MILSEFKRNDTFKFILLIKRQSCHHIETSLLICRANQLTGFYILLEAKFGNSLQVQ